MANIWRRQPSGRIISADFFKKSNSDVADLVAEDFFEYTAPAPSTEKYFFGLSTGSVYLLQGNNLINCSNGKLYNVQNKTDYMILNGKILYKTASKGLVGG
jgi:hypothetical protein